MTKNRIHNPQSDKATYESNEQANGKPERDLEN